MKLTISQADQDLTTQAKISDTLLKRLQGIVDDDSETDTERSNAKQALRFLQHLKRMDDAAKARIKPDQDGWYDALYVKPEENETVEIVVDGMVYRADYDGTWWWPMGGDSKPKAIINKWRLIK